MTWDMAIMYPILEMAGDKHHSFKEILYVYNTSNPLSDDKKNRELQLFFEGYIGKQKRYLPLLKLTNP
jgi:hypothetical protein